MLFLPSFDKESAVFLVRSGDNPKANAIVVAAEMKEQLWGAINRFLMKEAGEGKPYTIGLHTLSRTLLLQSCWPASLGSLRSKPPLDPR